MAVPKNIREKLGTRQVVLIYDEKNKDVHIVPVRSLRHWAGKAKGILKDYMKTHKDDWNDPYRR